MKTRMTIAAWLAVGLLLATGAVAQGDLLDGSLVARYNFDAAPVGSVIVDTSPAGSNHPGVNNGSTFTASATDGLAVTRPGLMDFVATDPDQITVAAHSDFGTSTGTLSMWVKSAGTAGPGNTGGILFDRRTGPGVVLVQNNNGTIFAQATSAPGQVKLSYSTTAAVNDDNWHHVAYAWDQAGGGTNTIYVDGVGATANSSGAWGWPTTQQIEIGRSHDGYWRRYDGLLDDYRIYNRTLSQAEIDEIRTSVPGPPPPPPPTPVILPIAGITGHQQGDSLNGNGSMLTTINGAGITKPDPQDPATWTHTNSWQTDWQGSFPGGSPSDADQGWAVVDLGSPQAALENLYLWNTNEGGGGLDRATREFNIYYATSPAVTPPAVGGGFQSYDFSSGGWTQLGGTETLTQGTGSPGLPVSGIFDISGASGAQFIGIDIRSDYGSTWRVGLGEIVVTAPGAPTGDIPEPITMLAVGLGITSLGGYIRNRRRA